jgi:hypothetical protein
MFARLTKRFTSKSTRTATSAAARPAMFEALEGRQLYSVSTTSLLPAVQTTTVSTTTTIEAPAAHPGGANIIAILIGL